MPNISDINPVFLAVFIIWTLIWKGLSLWQTARRGQKIWFLAILIVNTAGILEIIYLLIYRSPKKPEMINPLAPDHFAPPKNPNLP